MEPCLDVSWAMATACWNSFLVTGRLVGDRPSPSAIWGCAPMGEGLMIYVAAAGRGLGGGLASAGGACGAECADTGAWRRCRPALPSHSPVL